MKGREGVKSSLAPGLPRAGPVLTWASILVPLPNWHMPCESMPSQDEFNKFVACAASVWSTFATATRPELPPAPASDPVFWPAAGGPRQESPRPDPPLADLVLWPAAGGGSGPPRAGQVLTQASPMAGVRPVGTRPRRKQGETGLLTDAWGHTVRQNNTVYI